MNLGLNAGATVWPPRREGHCLVRLSGWLLLCFGFTPDPHVYASRSGSEWAVCEQVARDVSDFPRFVYGATLTAVDGATALLHGGLSSGGYVGERSSTFVMALVEAEGRGAPTISWTKVRPAPPNHDAGPALGDHREDPVQRGAKRRGASDQDEEEAEVGRGGLRFTRVDEAGTRTSPPPRRQYQNHVLNSGSGAGGDSGRGSGEGEAEGNVTIVPTPRGYHAAVMLDDHNLLVFGGICNSAAIAAPEVLNLKTWAWSRPRFRGREPAPRFGLSLTSLDDGRIVLIGGSTGSDLLRNGVDFADVHVLVEGPGGVLGWREATPELPCPTPRNLGREHSASLVGSKIVLFGGSRQLSNTIAVLDTDRLQWEMPRVFGPTPTPRHSHKAAVLGSKIVLFGGYSIKGASSAKSVAIDLATRRGALESAAGRANRRGPADIANHADDAMHRMHAGIPHQHNHHHHQHQHNHGNNHDAEDDRNNNNNNDGNDAQDDGNASDAEDPEVIAARVRAVFVNAIFGNLQ